MGATGALLFLFVIGHLVGNLQIFLPKESESTPTPTCCTQNAGLLWAVRLGMLAIVGLHVWSAVTLNAQNKSRAPRGYAGGQAPRRQLGLPLHVHDRLGNRRLRGLPPAPLHPADSRRSTSSRPIMRPRTSPLVVTSGPQDRAIKRRALESKIPAGPLEQKWTQHFESSWSTRPTSGNTRSSWSAPASPVPPPPPRSPNSATKVTTSSSTTARAAPTRRGAGRHQRRQELPERRRLGASPVLRHDQGRRLPGPRSERPSPRRGVGQHHRPVRRPRACRSPANTAACSTTAPSAAPRFRARSTRAARPGSNSCSAPIRRSAR
jgi:hypothetical protein